MRRILLNTLDRILAVQDKDEIEEKWKEIHLNDCMLWKNGEQKRDSI